MSRKLIFIDHSIQPGIFDASVEDTNGQHPIFCLCSKEVADEILQALQLAAKSDKVKIAFEERKKKFYLTLEEFVPIYGIPMLREFSAYWCEPNKSGTKFRQELEKTWDLSRRLKTWKDNSKGKYDAKPAQQNVIGRQSEETVRSNMTGWQLPKN